MINNEAVLSKKPQNVSQNTLFRCAEIAQKRLRIFAARCPGKTQLMANSLLLNCWEIPLNCFSSSTTGEVVGLFLSPFLMAQWVKAFALEAGRLGSILSRVKPKTLKLVSAVTLANGQQVSEARRMK